MPEEAHCESSNPVDIPYSTIGIDIREICHDANAVSLIISIAPNNDTGKITLEIPRILLDHKLQDCSDLPIIVLVDGEEISHEEIKTKKFRVVSFLIYEPVEEIEIVTGVIPTIGTISFMQCNEELLSEFSPLHQARYGILMNELICKSGLELIFKSFDTSPACVKPSTIQKLIEHGWTTSE